MGIEQSAPVNATSTFLFEKSRITISVPVDSAVYYAAKSTDKSVSIYGNVSESVWVTDSYLEMVNDPAQDRMYSDLLHTVPGESGMMKGFRVTSTLELMAAYTQSLTYETTPDNPTKYPVETVVEGAGDCDDKSVLLAGLLSREGYKVALLAFTPESHMALGVGSTGSLYKDTGYAYIETTNLSYVGIPPDELAGGVVLTSEPLVIPVGNGTILYSSGAETAYIHDMSTISGQKVTTLNAQLAPIASDLTAKQDQIAQLESRMQALRRLREYRGIQCAGLIPQRAGIGLQRRTLHLPGRGGAGQCLCRCLQLHYHARIRPERHLRMGEGEYAGVDEIRRHLIPGLQKSPSRKRRCPIACCRLQAPDCRIAVLPGDIDPDKPAPVFCRDKRCRSRAVERVEHDIIFVREKFHEPARQFLGKHCRVIELFHPVFGRDLPAADHPLLEFIGGDVDILAAARFFVGPLVKDLDKFPRVLDVGHGRRLPAPHAVYLAL